MVRKFIAILISVLFVFEQTGFAQIAPQLQIPAHLNGLMTPDRFRPVQVRYIKVDDQSRFELMVDRGDSAKLSDQTLQQTTAQLMQYFQIGLRLPNKNFWVNLRPDTADQIIDPLLEKTDLGKVLLAADLQLKKDLAQMTSPDTAEGRQYWNKIYQKANELYGADEDMEIPTITRPWIVPGEIIIRQTTNSAYVYKATLKVMLEQDYIKGSKFFVFKDSRAKAINEYATALVRELMLPKLTRRINASKKYADLRQAYYSLVLAQWYKTRFQDTRIDSKDLSGLTSATAWDKQVFYQAYKKSFEQGEYRKEETITEQGNVVVRQYVSGGIEIDPSAASRDGGATMVINAVRNMQDYYQSSRLASLISDERGGAELLWLLERNDDGPGSDGLMESSDAVAGAWFVTSLALTLGGPIMIHLLGPAVGIAMFSVGLASFTAPIFSKELGQARDFLLSSARNAYYRLTGQYKVFQLNAASLQSMQAERNQMMDVLRAELQKDAQALRTAADVSEEKLIRGRSNRLSNVIDRLASSTFDLNKRLESSGSPVTSEELGRFNAEQERWLALSNYALDSHQRSEQTRDGGTNFFSELMGGLNEKVDAMVGDARAVADRAKDWLVNTSVNSQLSEAEVRALGDVFQRISDLRLEDFSDYEKDLVRYELNRAVVEGGISEQKKAAVEEQVNSFILSLLTAFGSRDQMRMSLDTVAEVFSVIPKKSTGMVAKLEYQIKLMLEFDAILRSQESEDARNIGVQVQHWLVNNVFASGIQAQELAEIAGVFGELAALELGSYTDYGTFLQEKVSTLVNQKVLEGKIASPRAEAVKEAIGSLFRGLNGRYTGDYRYHDAVAEVNFYAKESRMADVSRDGGTSFSVAKALADFVLAELAKQYARGGQDKEDVFSFLTVRKIMSDLMIDAVVNKRADTAAHSFWANIASQGMDVNEVTASFDRNSGNYISTVLSLFKDKAQLEKRIVEVMVMNHGINQADWVADSGLSQNDMRYDSRGFTEVDVAIRPSDLKGTINPSLDGLSPWFLGSDRESKRAEVSRDGGGTEVSDEAKDAAAKALHNNWRKGVIENDGSKDLVEKKLETPRGRSSENAVWDTTVKDEIKNNKAVEVTGALTSMQREALNGGVLYRASDGSYAILTATEEIELDTINTAYDQLTPEWKAKNTVAVEAATGYYQELKKAGFTDKALQEALDKAISGAEYAQSDTLMQRIMDVGDREHIRWMEANSWEKDSRPDLFVAFSQLPGVEQAKDFLGLKSLVDYQVANAISSKEQAESKTAPGGIDFRALPLPAMNAPGALPLIDMKALQAIAANARIKDVDKAWKAIEKDIARKAVPCDKLKELVAVCCVNGSKYKVEEISARVAQIIELEEECAVQTSAQMQEVLQMLEVAA